MESRKNLQAMSGPATSSTNVNEPVSTSGNVPAGDSPASEKLAASTENNPLGDNTHEEQTNDVSSRASGWESPRQVIKIYLTIIFCLIFLFIISSCFFQ